MKKEHLKKELIYKEAIGRYDVIFTYKNHIRLMFMLPEEETNYADELMEDKTIKTAMRLYHLFYKIFGKSTFDYFCRETDFKFLLESHGGVIHKGEVFLEVVEEN